MFGSAIIDIAIGIVFVFLLVSVLASTINEIILSKLNMRGKELLEGLKTLLDDADATGLVNKLYNHGLIYGLFKGPFDPNKKGDLPSYIPAQHFVAAFLDIVPAAAQLAAPSVGATVAAGAGASQALAPPPANPPGGAPAVGAAAPPAQGQGQAPAAAAPPAALSQNEALFASLRVAAESLAKEPKTAKVGKSLLAMLNLAGKDAQKLQTCVEDWFNGAMDRVSGWYKYRTQWMLFWIGLVLAVAMNANTVVIVQQLSKDSALRQSVVAAAGAAKQPGGVTDQTIKQTIGDVRNQVHDISSLGIPLGWQYTAALWDFTNSGNEEPAPTTKELIFRKLVMLFGWLTTAIAVSLGAPFWFDLLNKFMVVRSTVKPREKSQDEGSKDS
jgi:hypothetical protein